MKIIPFNYRGLANPDKKLALCRLLHSTPYDVIFLQETLDSAKHITSTLLAICPGWTFQALDARGRSGGVAIATNPHTIRILNQWGGEGFLGIDIYSSELVVAYHLVHIYTPCSSRLTF